MASIAEIQLFTLVALIAVALGVYFGATQIDSLARHKYLKKKTGECAFNTFLSVQKLISIVFRWSWKTRP